MGYIQASLECRSVGFSTPVLLSSANSCDPVENSNNAGRFSGHMANSGRHLGGQQMPYKFTVHWPGVEPAARRGHPIQVTKVLRADMKALTHIQNNSLVLQ